MHGGSRESLSLRVYYGEVSPEAPEALGTEGLEGHPSLLAQEAAEYLVYHLSPSPKSQKHNDAHKQ